eukprot:GEMP01065828.1.p1 GENE.GEMP01065828.1~~GEMP01065828.1.p1  ORF type:complete len:265 (+),score=61.13 GEMP01065828.1:206-1000(+)
MKLILLPLLASSSMTDCLKYAKTVFAGKSMPLDDAINAVADDCALTKVSNAENYMCPDFRHFLTRAFHHTAAEMPQITAHIFCTYAENHYDDLRLEATHVGVDTGKEGVEHWKVSRKCPEQMDKVLKERTSPLKAGDVPDFWYSYCMNDDCSHFLPSQYRWCKKQATPQHSQDVCNDASNAAKDWANDFGIQKEVSAVDLCGMYDQFISSIHRQLNAYTHVVHEDSRDETPPTNAERALGSSQMVNAAQNRYLRNNIARPVKPH